MVAPGDDRHYRDMSPADPLPPTEPPAPERTFGSKVVGWIGALPSRIATRTGFDPVLVRGIMVLVLAVVVIVAVVVPISVFAKTPAPMAAAPSATPGHFVPAPDTKTDEA